MCPVQSMIISHINTCNKSISLNYQTFFKLYNTLSLQTSKKNIVQCVVNSILEKLDCIDYLELSWFLDCHEDGSSKLPRHVNVIPIHTVPYTRRPVTMYYFTLTLWEYCSCQNYIILVTNEWSNTGDSSSKWRKTCPSASLSTTNPTCSGLGMRFGTPQWRTICCLRNQDTVPDCVTWIIFIAVCW
jgi:hypothetical protein